MKKFFYVAIFSVLMFNVGVAQNTSTVQGVKDKIQTVSERFDSIAKEKGVLIDSINLKMSDTVLSVKSSSFNPVVVRYNDDIEDYIEDHIDYMYELIIPIVAITVPFISVILIVFICLIIGYKRRKAKYKIIELAIEKNYQLPEYLFNEKGNSSVTIEPVQNGNQNSTNSGQPKFKVSDWSIMKSGVKWTAVGFGLCLFFLLADGLPMVGICSIILLIGICKLVIAYNEQKYYSQRYSQQVDEPKQSPIMPPPLPTEEKKDSNNVSDI